jgi:hypothetical protein
MRTNTLVQIAGNKMEYQITINYSTDNDYINENIQALLENTLPFMVDNVKIHFDFDN